MPSSVVKVIASSSGLSIDDVEKNWDKAQKIVSSQYELTKEDDGFWKLVTSITKKMSGMEKKE